MNSDDLTVVARAGADRVVECAGAMTDVTLDALGSADPAGGGLIYEWTGGFGSAGGAAPVVSLPLGAVDRRAGLLRVMGKGRKERIVPLGEPSLESLDVYLEEGRPLLARRAKASVDEVFLSRRGAAMTRQNFFQRLRGIARRAGMLPHLFHIFVFESFLGGGHGDAVLMFLVFPEYSASVVGG